LTGLTTSFNAAIGDNAAALGRTGMIVAVSSGLVAGAALPAGAVAREAAGGAAPQTASVPLLAETASAPALAAGADALASAPVTASSQAKVTFDHSAFTARPKRAAAATTPAAATRDVASISRSLARTAYLASRPATPRRTSTASAGAGQSAPAPVPVLSSGRGATIVAIAMRYLGVPYVYGGASPRGFDCSGFTGYVFAQLGISLARSADGQYRSVPRISRSEAQPGDLVFYLSGGSAYHVGIYLGGNNMIAAPHTGTVVRVQPIYSSNIAFGRP
jgi:cell wall-associated NlpC family hydrolase